MAVHDGHNPQGPLVGRVGDKVIVYAPEEQGARGEISAAVALMGKRYKGGDSVENFVYDALSSIRTISAYVFGDFIEVDVSLGVKLIISHALGRRASIRSISRS